MASLKNYFDFVENYASDEELKDNSPKKTTTGRRYSRDSNYEETQMDISDESDNNSNKKNHNQTKRPRSTSKDRKSYESRSNNSRSDLRSSDSKYRKCDNGTRRRDERSCSPDRRNYGYRDERRKKYRSASRERRSYSRERRDKPRSRSRERKRSSSRERNHTPRYRRSRSRDRESKKYDKASNKMAQLKKLGIELPTYYNPSVVNQTRYADQIQKRKLLWQKKQPETEQPSSSGTKGKIWNVTTFAQDRDGKQAEKFKRLMGIKETESSSKGSKDMLKKQEEMFSSMEQQYEVARTATHTMRGVGLGFGSYQPPQ